MMSHLQPFEERPAAQFNDPDAPVQADQYAWELEELLRLYKHLGPMRVVEIGTFFGGTLYQWIKHASSGAHIIAIDMPNLIPGWTMPDDIDEQWRSWATARGQVRLDVIRGVSQAPETADRLKALTNCIDFLFIDGGHSYLEAKTDFDLYAPLVRRGGVIALHDILPTNHPGMDVWRLWKDIREQGYMVRELYAAVDQPRWGIGLVFV